MPFEPYTLLHTLAGSHVSGVNVLAFSSCGRYLASGSNDKSIIIWDPISGKSLQRIFVKDEVLSLIWHPRNCALYFGCQDGTLIVVENFSVGFVYVTVTTMFVAHLLSSPKKRTLDVRY